MSHVFVVDTNRCPLNPVHPGQARRLLTQGKAAVLRRFPFTIILKVAVEQPQAQPLRVKIDPGSKTTGLAIVNDASGEVVFAAELSHRGQAIKNALDDRRASRRSRRQRHTRYRQARWRHRRRPTGWLPPSLESRIANVLTWVYRLRRLAPVTALSQELVKFDLQAMENPEISGVEYQQGTLAGYELREYLLEKWQRKCAYCGAQNVQLQIEHIHPRAKGGTNRASNLTLACEVCNKAKDTQDIKVFLAHKPEILKRILAQAKAPLKDAAAVNTTRWALYDRLKNVGLPIECGSGGLTKYNRTNRKLAKTHWLDAACIGKSTPAVLLAEHVRPLLITATGSGNRQMCSQLDHGFPIGHQLPREKGKHVKGHRLRRKRHYGFQTGDMVRAIIPAGVSKYAGTYVTRVTVKASGSFKFRIGKQEIPCNHKYCTPIHRNDGYRYT